MRGIRTILAGFILIPILGLANSPQDSLFSDQKLIDKRVLRIEKSADVLVFLPVENVEDLSPKQNVTVGYVQKGKEIVKITLFNNETGISDHYYYHRGDLICINHRMGIDIRYYVHKGKQVACRFPFDLPNFEAYLNSESLIEIGKTLLKKCNRHQNYR